ncbi:GntR family transcriptional regulator / MocR family aminotransferase [Janthinobacterium sp. CG_23.3]|uniref:MocR-like pyridoxine biosynthesis transcription factor PdxR n=1 Tax=Janthinobacterium sp. CG_23.3 TaxID=3349634 RepID=UPI0038D3F463
MEYALLMAACERQHGGRGWSRQRLLHECLRAAIRAGQLGAGTRLVATRVLAAELGVARNSVLYAYEQLASEGYVVCDRRGTVVSTLPAQAPPARPPDGAAAPQAGLARRARALRQVTPQENLDCAFVPGVPALAAFPLALWRRMLERAWRALPAERLNYGDPAGEAPLRAAIAGHLGAARGVVCDAAQVFITDGTQSSLDLCARSFADEGELAWLENPGYGGALAACRGAGLAIAGIGVDDDGIAPTPHDWRRRPPRLIYTTPSHQYPTGGVLSLARRLALIDNARAAGALIIEDDYDSEFRHDGPPLPAMQGLVADAPVLYLGTFSKTMFPALRIGFIVVPAALAPGFAALLAQSAARGRVAEQLALAEFLRSGQFALHLRRMRRLYRQRRDALVAALLRHFGALATVHGGSAGMHLALRLHGAGLDDIALSAQAASLGIVAPALGAHACAAGAGWNGFMLGYAQVPVERVDAAVAELAALVRAAVIAGPASSPSSR